MNNTIKNELNKIQNKQFIYGYIRISTNKQNIDLNKGEILLKAKNLNLDTNNLVFVEEIITGKKHWKKRKLGELFYKCKKGDVIITSELSRIGRSIQQIMSFTSECTEKGVKLYITKCDSFKIDETISSQMLIFAYSLMSQIERQLISERTKTAMNNAKAKGIKLGRKKGSKGIGLKLDKHYDYIKKSIENGTTQAFIAKKFKVDKNTVSYFCKVKNIKKII